MRFIPTALARGSKPARVIVIAGIAALVVALALGTAPRAEDPPATETQSEEKAAEATAPKSEAPATPPATVSPEQGSDKDEAGQPKSDTPVAPQPTTESIIAKKPVSSQPKNPVMSSSESNLVNREVYVYKTIGRRDPFASLLEGEFETTVGHPLLDVSSMRLVGIVWGKADKFALIEDGRGHGHILRVGDPVINGYVVGLTQDELLVRQSSYGESQTVTIQLQRKESSSDAR
jgi:hypothetical protein